MPLSRWSLCNLGYFLAFLFGFFACLPSKNGGEEIAGTSVGTGNPGKIKLGFTSEGRTVAFSGTIELYGSTQIPLPGFNPEPLARFQMEGVEEFALEGAHLLAISDSTWPRFSTIGDSLHYFNLSFAGDSLGAFLTGFVFNSKSREFLDLRNQTAANIQVSSKIKVSLVPLKSITTWIQGNTLATERMNYLFVPGSNYYSLSDSGKFIFRPMPVRSYSLSFLSLPGKNRPTSDEDSAYVHGTSVSVSFGQIDTVIVTDLLEMHPLPLQYIR